MRTAEDTAAALGGNGRDADDAAGFLRPHRGDHRLRHQQRAAQADIEHRVIVGAFDVHQLQRLGDPGVIDQHIDPAVFRQNLFDGRLHLHFVGDVRRQAEMAFAQGRRGGFTGFAIEVDNDHFRAVFGE